MFLWQPGTVALSVSSTLRHRPFMETVPSFPSTRKCLSLRFPPTVHRNCSLRCTAACSPAFTVWKQHRSDISTFLVRDRTRHRSTVVFLRSSFPLLCRIGCRPFTEMECSHETL